ncbi:hypothetical protein F4780DRAFT_798148 [Xylariomycetidae sp. FL0641]|nr:hypothetical protein F4780DRAFT_798148 [Xylariomycetidae sp. FL0641]
MKLTALPARYSLTHPTRPLAQHPRPKTNLPTLTMAFLAMPRLHFLLLLLLALSRITVSHPTSGAGDLVDALPPHNCSLTTNATITQATGRHPARCPCPTCRGGRNATTLADFLARHPARHYICRRCNNNGPRNRTDAAASRAKRRCARSECAGLRNVVTGTNATAAASGASTHPAACGCPVCLASDQRHRVGHASHGPGGGGGFVGLEHGPGLGSGPAYADTVVSGAARDDFAEKMVLAVVVAAAVVVAFNV